MSFRIFLYETPLFRKFYSNFVIACALLSPPWATFVGAVPIFIQLLMSPNEDVREQAAWALGNIAGDSVDCRDMVLNHGALPALLQVSQVRDHNCYSFQYRGLYL